MNILYEYATCKLFLVKCHIIPHYRNECMAENLNLLNACGTEKHFFKII